MNFKQKVLRLSVSLIFMTSFVGLSFISITSAQGVDCDSFPHTTLTKTMPADAPYNIWLLAKKESASAKPYVKANNGQCREMALPSGSDWEWVRGASGNVQEPLRSGQNTFKLSVNGGAVLMDKLVVTNDLNCVPVGDGGNCIEAPLDFVVNGLQANEVVSGNKTVSAQLVTPLDGVTVDFLVDGNRLISRQTEAPFCMARINNQCREYNMEDLGEGSHTLNIRARTIAGQQTERNIPFSVAKRSIPVPEIPDEPTPEPKKPSVPTPTETLNVKVSGVKANETVSGKKTIRAEVSGTNKPVTVTFKLDNQHVSFRTAKPYCMVVTNDNQCGEWDSESLPNGTYAVIVVVNAEGLNESWTRIPIKISNTVNEAPAVPQPTNKPRKEIIIGNGKQKASGWIKALVPKIRLRQGSQLTFRVNDRIVYSKPAIAGDSVVFNSASFSNGPKTLSAVVTDPNGQESVVASEVVFENNIFTQAAAWMQENRTATLVGGIVLSAALFAGSYVLIQRYRRRQAIAKLTPHGVGNDEEVEVMDHKISVSKPVKVAIYAAHGFAIVAVVLLSGFIVYRLGSSALAAGLGFVAEVEDGIVTDASREAFFQDMDHADNRIYMRVNYGGSAPQEPEPEHPHEPEEPTNPTTPPTSSNPSTDCTPGTMASMGPCIDANAIPGPWQGYPANAGRRMRTMVHTSPTNSWDSFRHRCEYSHMNFDDPILYPGQQNRAHLHTFFGNSDTDYRSTSSSLVNSGGSTCSGGTLNRSAYWVPSMIDRTTGRAIEPLDDRSVYNSDLEIYYKIGYQGATPETIQPIPNGLHIITGNPANATSLADIPPQTTGVGYWIESHGRHYPVIYHCETDYPGFPRVETTPKLPYIPANCNRGQYLKMSIKFPGCWDGRNLTSPNGRSHMTYGRWNVGCPSSHPVVLPDMEMFIVYKVTTTNTSNWRLSSDNYTGGPGGGLSGHADYMFAWAPDAFPTVVSQCHRRLLDCYYSLAPRGYPGAWEPIEARQYTPRASRYIH